MILPDGGMNFFISWGFLEWLLTGILTALGAIIAWLWRLGGQVNTNTKELILMEKELGKLEVLVEQARKEREELKLDLIDKISQLPTRVFIESQIQQITGRIDGLIDAKLHSPRRTT